MWSQRRGLSRHALCLTPGCQPAPIRIAPGAVEGASVREANVLPQLAQHLAIPRVYSLAV
ncbi:MAG: hypothetical protein M1294_03795 [Firmicutes bacterium]|nr:hypothetical protein [Bacillota bacterium]